MLDLDTIKLSPRRWKAQRIWDRYHYILRLFQTNVKLREPVFYQRWVFKTYFVGIKIWEVPIYVTEEEVVKMINKRYSQNWDKSTLSRNMVVQICYL